MPWLYLLLAGALEIAWAVTLKFTDGYTRLTPTIIFFLLYITSVIFLGLALKSLPLGTAYAIWTGIGTVGAALFGIYLFGESMSGIRLLCIAMIILGIVGLKLEHG